jgi:hypothetical protein
MKCPFYLASSVNRHEKKAFEDVFFSFIKIDRNLAEGGWPGRPVHPEVGAALGRSLP